MLQTKQAIYLPYLSAAERKDFSQILSLFENGVADVDAVSNDGTSAMWMASAKGYNDIVKLLVRINADVNKCNNIGYSPLMIATHNNRKKTVMKLYEYGAHVNHVNKDGASCMYIAAKRGHVEMLRILRKIGCDVDKPDFAGHSPMLIAIKERSHDAVKMLYRLGADAGVVTTNGFLVFKSRRVIPGTVTDGVFVTDVIRDLMRRCDVCKMTSPKPVGCCRRCERVHYCSKECHIKARKKHRKECIKNVYFFL